LSFDFSLADELTEIVVPEVEVPALEFAKLEAVEPVVDVEMPAMGLDFSGIDFDFDKPEEPEPALAIEPTLAPIDVALTEATVESVVAITPVVEVENVESELSEAEQEVKTKLDLAQVYLEMGDAENAREILQEVIQEGNAEQQAHAHVLMKQVG
jgi:pilus assembly protein FimV